MQVSRYRRSDDHMPGIEALMAEPLREDEAAFQITGRYQADAGRSCLAPAFEECLHFGNVRNLCNTGDASFTQQSICGYPHTEKRDFEEPGHKRRRLRQAPGGEERALSARRHLLTGRGVRTDHAGLLRFSMHWKS